MKPNRTYYLANEGFWRGPFDFEITNRAAFRACPMGLLDRMRLRSMSLGQRTFGAMELETSVDCSGIARAEVVHTTRLLMAGIPMLSGVEVMTLGEDGFSVELRCEHRLGPTFIGTRTFAGRAEVAPDGKSARYSFSPWFGTTLYQVGEIEGPDATTLTQRTDWSLGVQRLRRAAR